MYRNCIKFDTRVAPRKHLNPKLEFRNRHKDQSPNCLLPRSLPPAQRPVERLPEHLVEHVVGHLPGNLVENLVEHLPERTPFCAAG